ncbi:MAG: hypothetical protein ACLRZH_02065 [Ruthenibacterium lactatiformans]
MEFTIENNFLCVRVQSRGAELCSVVKMETGEEMLWQADPAVEPACAYSVPLLRAAEGRRVHPQRRVL